MRKVKNATGLLTLLTYSHKCITNLLWKGGLTLPTFMSIKKKLQNLDVKNKH